MRIISPFHDYYDAVGREGRDDTVVYRRKPRLGKLNAAGLPAFPWLATDSAARSHIAPRQVRLGPPRRQEWRDETSSTLVTQGLVLVAGHAHPVWLYKNWASSFFAAAENRKLPFPVDLPPHVRNAQSLGAPSIQMLLSEHRQAYLNKHPLEPSQTAAFVAGFAAHEIDIGDSWRTLSDPLKSPAGRAYVAALDRCLNHDWTSLHLRSHSPLLLLSPPPRATGISALEATPYDALMLVNPSLAQLHFATIMDPYSAFQEVSMFVGGVMAAPANPMVEISDKTKILKAGLDPVYGFRTRARSKS